MEKYPEFKECYRDIMMFRQKPEELIGMFSKALYEMDRNTEKYMVRELQEELDATKLVVAERDNQIAEQSKKIQALYEELQALKENK